MTQTLLSAAAEGQEPRHGSLQQHGLGHFHDLRRQCWPYSHQSLAHHPHISRSAPLHRAQTLAFLFLYHLSTTNLLIIAAPSPPPLCGLSSVSHTWPVPRGFRWGYLTFLCSTQVSSTSLCPAGPGGLPQVIINVS